VVAFFVQRTHSEITEKGSKGGHLGHFRATLKEHYRILTTAGIAQLFAQMIRTSRDVIIPLYAADILGLDVRAIGWVVSISSGIDMTLFLPAGYIMDRWGRKFAIVPCFLIQAIGMALIPLTGGFLSLTLVTALIGFGNGLGSGTMMTLGTDLAPPATRGEFLGIWRFVGDGGQTAAPLIVGSVADAVGLQLGALSMAGAGIVAVLIFAFLVPETLKKKQPVTAVET
jgi:MFS family permease